MTRGSQPVWFELLLLAAMATFSPDSAAFPLQRNETAGQAALRQISSGGFWLRHDFGVIDGSVTSTPPDATRYDRRIENLLFLGGNYQATPKIGFRLGFSSEMSRYRLADELEEDATTDGTRSFYQPSLDITFLTPSGLSVFVGLQKTILGPYKERFEASFIDSETKFNAASVDSPRLGAIRQTGSSTFGMYYAFGEETERRFRKSASDGTDFTGSDIVHVPTEIGLFAQFGVGTHALDFEFRAIQAGEGGNRSEDGNAIADDHFIARLGGHYNFGVYRLLTSAQHKTLSYSKSAYMTLETIPATSFDLGLQAGQQSAYARGGITFISGRDVQSLPEFNARYEVRGYALSIGVGLSL